MYAINLTFLCFCLQCCVVLPHKEIWQKYAPTKVPKCSCWVNYIFRYDSYVLFWWNWIIKYIYSCHYISFLNRCNEMTKKGRTIFKVVCCHLLMLNASRQDIYFWLHFPDSQFQFSKINISFVLDTWVTHVHPRAN